MDKALKSVLEWWDAAGVDVPAITPSAKPKPQSKTAAANPQSKGLSKAAPSRAKINAENKTEKLPRRLDTTPIAAAAKTLSDLKLAIETFDAGPLSSHARQSVFARGNPEADVMIIGEAPNREEDIAGKPFMGRDGLLLDRMMASIGLSEQSVYMTTVMNWRQPQNRNPKPEDVEICLPFILRHIELAAPKFIVLLGNVSLSALTNLTGVMKNRGQWQTVSIGDKNIPALPIYHPALLIKQPALKKEAWRDLLELRQKLLELT